MVTTLSVLVGFKNLISPYTKNMLNKGMLRGVRAKNGRDRAHSIEHVPFLARIFCRFCPFFDLAKIWPSKVPKFGIIENVLERAHSLSNEPGLDRF